MKDSPAIYLGRMVDKEHFRAFIYSYDGSKKLVNSWDEYEAHVETGLWFATAPEKVEEALEIEEIKEVKPKKRRVNKKSKKEAEIVEASESLPEKEAFETEDDFLPKD